MKKLLSKIFEVEEKDIQLTEVQRKVSKIKKNKNVLILSSCGSGKTEVAYYLSKLWGDKLIYTLPMKTLATSIYKRFCEYEDRYGEGKKWTLQHSNVYQDKFLENELCVTTIDQVLSGYFGIGVQSFIKGKNVVNSNFIFDEIQLFEPEKMLKSTILMLDNLFQQGNKFCIMTATMPCFLIEFLSKRYDMEVIITENPSVKNRNVKIHYNIKLDFDEIKQYPEKQIIICNTQREQEYITECLMENDRVIVLNSKFLNSDRTQIEKEVIKYFGKDSKPNNKILISTQILEAGMDISADRIYSSLSSIDSLVQRDGRCCRWGGNGDIFVFEGNSSMYDDYVCNSTRALLRANNGCYFTWEIQKDWINKILNSFYKPELTNLSLKRFKLSLKNGDRLSLIREVDSVNIIVVNNENLNVKDFNRESISISMFLLERIASTNKLYRLNMNKKIEEIPFGEVNFGDTYIIQGKDCFYGNIGFRFLRGHQSIDFKFKSNEFNDEYTKFDYVEEPWITHALAVRNIFKLKMSNEKRFNLSNEEIERYSFLAGLHDLGKCTLNWQTYIEAKDVILAHNKFKSRNKFIIKDLPHKYVTSVFLKNYINNFESNILLQHHGRIYPNNDIVQISKFEYSRLLMRELKLFYGLNENIKLSNDVTTFADKDIYTPYDDDWVKFLKVVGTLMESDIEAIKEYNCNKTMYLN